MSDVEPSALGDDDLQAVLAMAIDEVDPVPDRVVAAARAAWTWRDVDVELAELVADSSAEPAAAGVRSAADTRTVTFASERLEIEVMVLAHVGRQLVGQLVPAQPAEVELRLPSGPPATTTAGERGDFVFQNVPTGPAQLLIHSPEGAVATDWIVL